MTYKLGPSGSLTALPDPESGIQTSYERLGGTHQLLGGQKVRDTIGRLRTWQLSWLAIDAATYNSIKAFFLGTVGAGPYSFIDPEESNPATGDGSWLVTVESLSKSTPIAGVCDAQMTLVQVG